MQLKSHFLHEASWELIPSTQLDRLCLCFHVPLGFVFPLWAYTLLNCVHLLLAYEHVPHLFPFCQRLTFQIIFSFKWGGRGLKALILSAEKIHCISPEPTPSPPYKPWKSGDLERKDHHSKVFGMTKCTDPGLQTMQ